MNDSSFLYILDQWDRQLFAFLNHLHADWLDPVMVLLSTKTAWIPVYVIFLWFIVRKEGWKNSLWTLLMVAVAITLADQICSSVLKPWIARFRPCQPEAGLGIEVYLATGKCGGKFGFASSHAANFFALATCLQFVFTGPYGRGALYLIAALVAYSRIYLGVHYPGDILAGALIGCLTALFAYRLTGWIRQKIPAAK